MNAPTTIKWKGVTFSVSLFLTLKELSAKTSPQFVSLLKSLSDRGIVAVVHARLDTWGEGITEPFYETEENGEPVYTPAIFFDKAGKEIRP